MSQSQKQRNRNRKDPSRVLLQLPFIALLFYVSCGHAAQNGPSPELDEETETVESCGGFGSGWTKYKDNKCIKVMGIGTQSEGQLACFNEQRTLNEGLLHVNPSNPEQQEFMSKFIWEEQSNKYDNVNFWLARRYRANRIVREELTPAQRKFLGLAAVKSFSGFGLGPGLGTLDPDICIQMEPPLGERKETSCSNKNLAICQKPQKWTYQKWGGLTRSMKELMEMAKAMKESVDEMERRLGPLWTEFERRTKRSIVLSSRCVKRVAELREQMSSISKAMERAQRDLNLVQKALDFLRTKFNGFKDVLAAYRIELEEAKVLVNSPVVVTTETPSTSSPRSTTDSEEEETTEAPAIEKETTEVAAVEEKSTQPPNFSVNMNFLNGDYNATDHNTGEIHKGNGKNDKGKNKDKNKNKDKKKDKKKKDKKKKDKKKKDKKKKEEEKKEEEKKEEVVEEKKEEDNGGGGGGGGRRNCGFLGLGCLFGKK